MKRAFKRISFVVACLAISALIAANELFLLDPGGMVGTLRTSRWIVYIAAASSIYSLWKILLSGNKTIWLLFLSCVLTIGLFAMSLRSLVFNPVSGELRESWAGVFVSGAHLDRTDNIPYCISIDSWYISISRDAPEYRVSFFRGLWSKAAVESAVPLEHCEH